MYAVFIVNKEQKWYNQIIESEICSEVLKWKAESSVLLYGREQDRKKWEIFMVFEEPSGILGQCGCV